MDGCTWASVWALTSGGGIVFRQGVRAEDRKGVAWAPVDSPPTPAPPAGIVLDAQGRPWLYTTAGDVCVREGVTREAPVGVRWSLLTRTGLGEGPGARVACVAAGPHGQAWACTAAGDVYVRTGHTPDAPYGVSWTQVKGALLCAALATDGGALWGANASGTLFARTGLSVATPHGAQWAKIERPRDTHVRGVVLSDTQALCLGKSGEVWAYSGSVREPKAEASSWFFGSSGGDAVWHPLRWQAQAVSLNLQTNDIWVTTTTGSVILLQRPDTLPRDAPIHTWASAVAMQQIASSGFTCVIAGASANHRVPSRVQPTSGGLPAPQPSLSPHAHQHPSPANVQPVQHDGMQGSGAAFPHTVAAAPSPYAQQGGKHASAADAAGASATGKARGHVLSGVPITIVGAHKRTGGSEFFMDVGNLPSPSSISLTEYSFEVEREVIARF